MSNRRIFTFCASAFVIAVSGSAFAADMAVKAPPPAPAPVYSWTGWYVGGNIGGGWGDARTDIAGSGTSISFPAFLPLISPNPPTTFAGSHTDSLTGVIGGGQLGYNYQVGSQWVLGLEADIQGSGERGSNTFNDPLSGTICSSVLCPAGPIATISGAAVTSYEAKIDWFGTVRPRLGYLVNDQVLLYATGGLAYGRVGISGNSSVNGSLSGGGFPTPFPFTAAGATAFSESNTNIGWTAGAGIEGRFANWLPAGWTWKLEYLYLDLGSLDTTNPFPPAIAAAILKTTPFTGTFTTHTHFTDNIVRVGLNYQFH